MSIFVNDVEITDQEVHAEMQYHPAPSVEAARHEAAQALVIRQLLLQAAMDQELLDAPGTADMGKTEDAIDRLLHREVRVPEADEESCKRYYEQNLERFMDKSTDRVLPFESVFSHIRGYLHARSLKTGISQYIKLLAGKARIVGFNLEGGDGPLVQ